MAEWRVRVSNQEVDVIKGTRSGMSKRAIQNMPFNPTIRYIT